MSISCRTRNGKVETVVSIVTGLTSVNVPCEVVGPFAIHRTIYPLPGAGITLTHIRSGLRIRRFGTRLQARHVANALIGLGNWDRPESRLPKKLRREAGAVIKRLAPLAN